MAQKVGYRARTPRDTACPAAQDVPQRPSTDRAKTAQLRSVTRHPFFHGWGGNRAAAATLAFTLVVLLGATGCNGDTNADAEADPSPSTTPATSASPSSTPSPTATGWESAYTDEQLAKYEEALRRWEDYERESEPVWSDPSPSDATLKFFRSYFYAPEQMQSLLERNAQVEIKIEGLPTVLRSEATGIAGSAVTIRQCIDLTSQLVTQYGEPTEGRPTEPQVRVITLSRPAEAKTYLISGVDTPGDSCPPE